jgi:molybdopterin synthase catalytic subunit
MTLLEVTSEPLDVAAHESAAHHPAAGAMVTFCGVIRDHDRGRQVVALEYEAHPSAQAVLEEIAGKFVANPEVLGLAMSHRVGRLEIGDPALIAVVSCAHRREAFALCAELVNSVKHALPVWKRQVFADGTDEWVNCP